MKQGEHYLRLSKIAKALSSPARLLLMDVLAKRGRCVSELTGILALDQTTVSKHLLVLKNAGLVVCEKKGLFVIYRSAKPCVSDFMTCLNRASVGGRSAGR